MKKLIIGCMILLYGYLPVQAAQIPSTEDKENTEQSEPEKNNKREKKNTRHTFNPSERISEDIPVAFPVDI